MDAPCLRADGRNRAGSAARFRGLHACMRARRATRERVGTTRMGRKPISRRSYERLRGFREVKGGRCISRGLQIRGHCDVRICASVSPPSSTAQGPCASLLLTRACRRRTPARRTAIYGVFAVRVVRASFALIYLRARVLGLLCQSW